MGECTVFTGVCLLTFRGGGGYPRPTDGGTTSFPIWGGGTPSFLMGVGGILILGQEGWLPPSKVRMRQGVPRVPPVRRLDGGTPRQDWMGVPPLGDIAAE